MRSLPIDIINLMESFFSRVRIGKNLQSYNKEKAGGINQEATVTCTS